MTSAAQPLLAELDTAFSQASQTWRATALRQIADLFVASAALYSAEQIALFDDVICRLIPKMDRTALAELSNKLAPVGNAPVKAIASLARNADLAVAGPILEFAAALPDEDLIAIAGRIDLKLLPKIAARTALSEAVTDILLERGNAAIKRRLIDNPNARMSETGFARMVSGINGDKELATALAARQDVPDELRVWLDAVLNPKQA